MPTRVCLLSPPAWSSQAPRTPASYRRPRRGCRKRRPSSRVSGATSRLQRAPRLRTDRCSSRSRRNSVLRSRGRPVDLGPALVPNPPCPRRSRGPQSRHRSGCRRRSGTQRLRSEFDAGPFYAGFGIVVQPDAEAPSFWTAAIIRGQPFPVRHSRAAALCGDAIPGATLPVSIGTGAPLIALAHRLRRRTRGAPCAGCPGSTPVNPLRRAPTTSPSRR